MSNEGSNSDEVSNMISHLPNTVGDISIETSIREWEEGTSQNALVSCKDRFVGKPSHGEFISELDRGEEVVRCSGWRNFTPFLFSNSPLNFPKMLRSWMGYLKGLQFKASLMNWMG